MPPDFTRSREHLLSVLDALPVGVLLVNADANIVFSNLTAEKILGFEADELLNVNVHNLVPKPLREKHLELVQQYTTSPIARAMDSGRQLTAIKKNGDETKVQLGLSPLLIAKTRYTLVSILDAKNHIINTASHHDTLTGLANRSLFDELSDTLRSLAIRNKVSITVMFVDLDNFKLINDGFGHDIGDSILKKVANILSKNVRKNDVVARIGGDEFTLCLYGNVDTIAIKKMADNLISEIQTLNKDLMQGSQHTHLLGASIGVFHTTQAADVLMEEMIKKADQLMYQAKAAGKNNVIFKMD